MEIQRYRNSAKAVIVENGRLLTVCRLDRRYGEWFLLPGGGQRPGETLHEALRREVREEADIEIDIGPLVWTREYIGAHHEFADEDADMHQIEFMFVCRRRPGGEPRAGASPDADQVRVEWIALEDLSSVAFYPKALVPLLRQNDDLWSRETNYLGDVN